MKSIALQLDNDHQWHEELELQLNTQPQHDNAAGVVEAELSTGVKLTQHQVGLHSVHDHYVHAPQVALVDQESTARRRPEMIKLVLQTITQNHL